METANISQPAANLGPPTVVQPESKKVRVSGYIFWGLTIPPFTTIWSLYSASKKGVLHVLIPTMTIVYTILFAAFSFSVIYSPKAFSDVSAVKFAARVQIPAVPSWFITSTIVLTFGGLLGGWYLQKIAKQQGSLSKMLMAVLLVILLLQFFVEFRELVFINTIISKSIGDIYPGL